jgi:hypothetical protein
MFVKECSLYVVKECSLYVTLVINQALNVPLRW